MTKQDKYHFIGIGGVGMSGLARLLIKSGCQVSGSDLAKSYITKGLEEEGALVSIGHLADHVQEGMTVIYTTGIDESNPELLAARRYGCPVLHRSDLLKHLMKDSQVLAVAGTHGKTTTSGLLASTLMHMGLDPTFAIGGVLTEFHSNAHKGNGQYFVAEACESDGTFSKYQTFGGVVTNVDFDHMDFFETKERLCLAFKEFIEKVSRKEHLFWCGDDKHLREMDLPGLSYGRLEKCDLRIINERQEGWTLFFDIAFLGRIYEGIKVPLIGHHNALNAAAVFGLLLSLGLEEEAIKAAFLKFEGVCRRAEKKGVLKGIEIIDDYAHHPTELSTTLYGMRKAIKERRLIAVYQPHRYTRTKDCLGLFSKVFDAADNVIITDIYSAGESKIPGIDPQAIIDDISGKISSMVRYVKREDLVSFLAEFARPHDVIVTLGAGDVTSVGPQLLKIWEKKPPKKLSIGVVFGGKSLEHEISLLSARNVIDSLDDDLYDTTLFKIQKSGRWTICRKDFSEEFLSKEDEIISSDTLKALLNCDVFFPVIHGPYGEDGTLQGFFDMLGKAYVGCDHRSAAICMDKALTKKVASLCGIAVIPFLSFSEPDWRENRDVWNIRIQKELTYPVFVKPLHLGSTVGITKVENPDDLEKAIELAFSVDTRVLVENGLKVREIEFAVLGNETALTFPPGEILTGAKVYDYHGKYDEKSLIKSDPEAKLSEALVELGMALAKKAYLAMECKGLARVDFFLDHEGQLWLNEINPIPGFTKHSLYPQICALHGLKADRLANELIVLAMERKRGLERSLENLDQQSMWQA